jgi:hypothetical protein
VVRDKNATDPVYLLVKVENRSYGVIINGKTHTRFLLIYIYRVEYDSDISSVAVNFWTLKDFRQFEIM